MDRWRHSFSSQDLDEADRMLSKFRGRTCGGASFLVFWVVRRLYLL